MKEDELRKHAECDLCGQGIGATGAVSFWRVTLEHFVVDLQACQRQDGLTAMLGGHALLARHMGPNEDLAKRVGNALVVAVCESCAVQFDAPCVARMAEIANDRAEGEEL